MVNKEGKQMEYGYGEGEVCKRKGCKGVLAVHPVEGCSCHIHPPCGACTEPAEYCPECGYERKDDFVMNGFVVSPNKETGVFRSWEPRPLDNTKIDWRHEHHTHFTMKKVGVCPEGTTTADILKAVGEGTFGGRFEQFGGGRFTYIAYTD
jgi:hypothetical protein